MLRLRPVVRVVMGRPLGTQAGGMSEAVRAQGGTTTTATHSGSLTAVGVAEGIQAQVDARSAATPTFNADKVSGSLYAAAMRQCEDVAEARALLDQWWRTPGSATESCRPVNAMVRLYASHGDVLQAVAVIRQLVERSVPLQASTLNSFLHGLDACPSSVALPPHTLRKAARSMLGFFASKGVELPPASFHALLRVFARHPSPTTKATNGGEQLPPSHVGAEDWIHRVRRVLKHASPPPEDMVPPATVPRVLTPACSAAFREAYAVVNTMRNAGLRTTPRAVMSLFHVAQNSSDVDAAIRVAHHVHGLSPPVFVAAVEACVEHCALHAALQFIAWGESRRLVDTFVYEAVMVACWDAHAVSSVCHAFDALLAAGRQPTTKATQLLLAALPLAGTPAHVHLVWTWLNGLRGVSPPVVPIPDVEPWAALVSGGLLPRAGDVTFSLPADAGVDAVAVMPAAIRALMLSGSMKQVAAAYDFELEAADAEGAEAADAEGAEASSVAIGQAFVASFAASGDLRRAVEAIHAFASRGLAPSEATLAFVIGCVASPPAVKFAFQAVKAFVLSGQPVTHVTAGALHDMAARIARAKPPVPAEVVTRTTRRRASVRRRSPTDSALAPRGEAPPPGGLEPPTEDDLRLLAQYSVFTNADTIEDLLGDAGDLDSDSEGAPGALVPAASHKAVVPGRSGHPLTAAVGTASKVCAAVVGWLVEQLEAGEEDGDLAGPIDVAEDMLMLTVAEWPVSEMLHKHGMTAAHPLTDTVAALREAQARPVPGTGAGWRATAASPGGRRVDVLPPWLLGDMKLNSGVGTGFEAFKSRVGVWVPDAATRTTRAGSTPPELWEALRQLTADAQAARLEDVSGASSEAATHAPRRGTRVDRRPDWSAAAALIGGVTPGSAPVGLPRGGLRVGYRADTGERADTLTFNVWEEEEEVEKQATSSWFG